MLRGVRQGRGAAPGTPAPWAVAVWLQVRAPASPGGEQGCAREPFAPPAPSSAPQQHKHRQPRSSGAGGDHLPPIYPPAKPLVLFAGPRVGRTLTGEAAPPPPKLGPGGWRGKQAGSPQTPGSFLTPASLLSVAHRSSVCIS